MLRITAASLTLAMITVVGVTTAFATPIHDPIVRTRGGGTGSYQIFPGDLPYFFNFGSFATDPDSINGGDSCTVGSEGGMPKVTCDFQNLTGQVISQLTFQGSIPDDPNLQSMQFEDPNNLFTTDPDNFILTPPASFTAVFTGGGVVSGSCIEGCFGGDFSIDLVGFPLGSNITMLATVAADAVPEPASLMLLGTGLGLGAALLSRRKRAR